MDDATTARPEKNSDAPKSESSFTLSPAESQQLQQSIDQASRGEVIDGWKLLKELWS